MTKNQKINETGWFYHAPPKAEHHDPIGVPPASQIPGLSDVSALPADDQSKKMWFRDTDTDYIRLCKMGGRQDLLRQRTPKARSDKPTGYPRCDWFYHSDAAAEADGQAEQEDHQFYLPDYMVHQEWNPQLSPTYNMAAAEPAPAGQAGNKRAPYAFDKDTVFSREGERVRDKTVRLPEIRREGYGIRAGKLHGKQVKHVPIDRPEMIKPRSPQVEHGKNKYQPMDSGCSDKEAPIMGKLMSHGYNQDWQNNRDTWYDKQSKMRVKFDNAKLDQQTEYQEKIGLAAEKGSTPAHKHRPARTEPNKEAGSPGAKSRRAREEEEAQKELFKLSKFKKVAAKTDSHRPRNQRHSEDGDMPAGQHQGNPHQNGYHGYTHPLDAYPQENGAHQTASPAPPQYKMTAAPFATDPIEAI